MVDNKKVNKIRRQRGYSFEKHIVKEFQDRLWSARRLGSPSTELPDVFAISSLEDMVIAVEAKSTVANIAYVPEDQVYRCIEWANMFDRYLYRKVILAFKFKGIPEKRKLRYHYKIFPHEKINSCDIRCNYEGVTTDNEKRSIFMADFNFEKPRI